MPPTSLSAASSLSLSSTNPVKNALATSSPVLPHIPSASLLQRMASTPTLDTKSTLQTEVERLEKEKHAEIEEATTACRESIEQCQADTEQIQKRIDALQSEKKLLEAGMEHTRGPMPYALLGSRDVVNAEILKNIEKLTHCYTQITNCNHEIEAATLVICEKHNPEIDRIREQLTLFDKEV